MTAVPERTPNPQVAPDARVYVVGVVQGYQPDTPAAICTTEDAARLAARQAWERWGEWKTLRVTLQTLDLPVWDGSACDLILQADMDEASGWLAGGPGWFE